MEKLINKSKKLIAGACILGSLVFSSGCTKTLTRYETFEGNQRQVERRVPKQVNDTYLISSSKITDNNLNVNVNRERNTLYSIKKFNEIPKIKRTYTIKEKLEPQSYFLGPPLYALSCALCFGVPIITDPIEAACGKRTLFEDCFRLEAGNSFGIHLGIPNDAKWVSLDESTKHVISEKEIDSRVIDSWETGNVIKEKKTEVASFIPIKAYSKTPYFIGQKTEQTKKTNSFGKVSFKLIEGKLPSGKITLETIMKEGVNDKKEILIE